MLQLRKSRFFTPKGQNELIKYDAPLDPDIVVQDVGQLLDNLDEILKDIPEKERFNLFCTVGHVKEDRTDDAGKPLRTWASQDMFFFDIDDIDIDKDGNFNETKYLQAVGQALNVDPAKMVVIYTGHGLHVLVKTKKPWSDEGFFKENRLYYEFACIRINDKLSEYALGGKADRAVFAPKYMLRLPLTLNKKPGKPIHQVRALTKALEPIEFDLKKLSGVPTVLPEDQLSAKALSYFKIDSQAVEDRCLFLQDVKASAGDVDEPTWYAALSIVGRLDGGEKLAHEYSKGHRSYTPPETDRKVGQALKSAGPRTCDSIASLWGGCDKCPYYKKVQSPIALRGENFIATSHSGFHLLGKKGALVPQYEDLRKYYDSKLPYININDTHYRYEETHWVYTQDTWIDNYAHKKFSPTAKNNMCNEFRGIVKRTNLDNQDFFTQTIDRKINLRNGVLDIDTKELLPHDPKYGFQQTLDFDYAPDADCPTFKRMLDNVTCGDKDLQENLLQFMGYALSNDEPRADKVLVLTGDGQNGKSRFMEVLRALGGNGVTSLKVNELQNPFFRQQLDGALFNIIEEMPPFVKKDFWEDIKGLATGALVTASKKFKDPYTFPNRAKIIMTCNKLPTGTDPSHGFFRRLLIVPFNALFTHAKGNIEVDMHRKIIDNELPGALNMVLEAYDALIKANYRFTSSKASQEALDEYRQDSDNVLRWCNTFLELGVHNAGDTVPEWIQRNSEGVLVALVPEMRKSYALWAEGEGEKAVSSVNFTKRLQRWGKGGASENPQVAPPAYKRSKINGIKQGVIQGVKWVGASEY